MYEVRDDEPDERADWPADRLAAAMREYRRAKATVVPVEAIMETNAGDEHHLAENWRECPDCGVDMRIDHDVCWRCGR